MVIGQANAVGPTSIEGSVASSFWATVYITRECIRQYTESKRMQFADLPAGVGDNDGRLLDMTLSAAGAEKKSLSVEHRRDDGDLHSAAGNDAIRSLYRYK